MIQHNPSLLTSFRTPVDCPSLSTILSLLFGLTVAVSAPSDASSIPLSAWQAEQGDRFIADTRDNIGYLVHEDGRYTSVLIGSGRRHVVRYIGRTYNATTPSMLWEVRSMDIKGDRSTFGKSGRFLRLYENGERTAYGIHSTSNIAQILSFDDRYKSFGCILVDESVIDHLLAAYDLNGGTLAVATTYGIDVSLLPTAKL